MICTLGLFLFRPGYLFPGSHVGIDHWLYAGLQWDFRRQLTEFGPTYYSSRLSAILPQAAFHCFLPAAFANIVAKLALSAFLATGFATIGFHTGGFRAAFIAVVLGVCCPEIVWSVSSNYVDAYVILYAVLTMACVVVAKDSARWPAWMFLAGCSFALMVVGNIPSMTSPVLGVAVFSLCWLQWNVRRLLAGTRFFIVGCLTVLFVLGGINAYLGGPFNFLQPQIQTAVALVNQLAEDNPYAPVSWNWVTRATWLVLPVCGLLWGAYRSWLRPPTDDHVRLGIRSLTGGLLVSLAIVIPQGIYTGSGITTLCINFFSSFHSCLAVPLLAATCVSFIQEKPPTILWAGLSLGACVIVALIGIPCEGWILPSFLDHDQKKIVASLALLPLAMLVSRLSFPADSLIRKVFLPEILLVGLINGSASSYYRNPEPHLREGYVSVHAAFQELNRMFPADSYRTWEHPGNRESLALTSSKFWSYRLFTQKPFPQFDLEDINKLAGRTLIITAPAGRGDETVAEAKQKLAQSIEVTREQIIRVPGDAGTGFDLVALWVKEKPH